MARSRSSSSSSRSLSPYNKRNRPPRRSRSTDRRRSNRGRRSSPRRSRSHSRRRDGHSFVRRRSPRRFTRRSPSPRARRRSRSRQRKSPGRRSRSPTRRSRSPNRRAKSPGRRSRSPPTKSTQEKKFSTSGDRRRSVSPKTRFAEKPGSRERPRESRDTSSKHVHEAESSRYSKASGGEDDQRGGNRPSLLPTNKNAEKALYDGGAHRRPSPVRKDVARPPPSDHHEHPRSRSPVSRNDRPPTRTQSAEGRLAGFGSRRDHPREDRHGFYVTASEKNAVKAGLSQDRPMREAGECAPIRNVSPPHRGRGVIRQTSTTLHERFSLAQGVSTRSAFVPPEQITIGIERNIPGNEPTVMRSEFRPEDVVVIRRKDEGVCPFYERQEFQTRHDEEQYNERRVVKIVRPNVLPRGDKGMSKFEREYQMKNFEVQSNQLKMEPDSCTGDRVTLSDRWGVVKRDPEVLCSHAVENVIHRRHDVTVIDTHDRLPDSRTGGTARDERMLSNKRFSSSGEFGEYDRFQPDPNDLRHNLVVRRRTGGPEPSDSRYRLGRSDDGEFHRQREVIQQRGLMDRRGAVIGGKPRLTSLVGHAEVGARSMDTRSVLPDFSKRDNKYDYQAWEDHPEMIPRGSSYFEHDNRDDFNYRGRRGFGRGPFRGGGRGRGMGRRDFVASEPTWKHDKYQEIEEEEDDNKPTSTT